MSNIAHITHATLLLSSVCITGPGYAQVSIGLGVETRAVAFPGLITTQLLGSRPISPDGAAVSIAPSLTATLPLPRALSVDVGVSYHRLAEREWSVGGGFAGPDENWEFHLRSLDTRASFGYQWRSFRLAAAVRGVTSVRSYSEVRYGWREDPPQYDDRRFDHSTRTTLYPGLRIDARWRRFALGLEGYWRTENSLRESNVETGPVFLEHLYALNLHYMLFGPPPTDER